MKRTPRSSLIAVGLASVLAVGAGVTAYASGDFERYGKGRHFEFMLEQADKDGDGGLSRSEIDAFRAETFQSFDSDGDGALTPGEMRTGMMGRMFDRIDDDGDGMLSREEFANMTPRRGGGMGWGMHQGYHGHGYHYNDDDDDDEYERRGEHHRGYGMMGGARGMMGGMMGRGFGWMDRDEDGRLSSDEAASMVDRMFERHDDNDDGIIQRDEMGCRW